MGYVIYNIESTRILQAAGQSWGCYVDSYKTESAAKAALTRLEKKDKLGKSSERVPHVYPNGMEGYTFVHTPYVRADFAIAESSDFRENIEKQVTKLNLMSGKEFTQSINTPASCDPSTETYWCM